MINKSEVCKKIYAILSDDGVICDCFYSKLLEIEKFCQKNDIFGKVFEFHFPYKKNCFLIVESTKEGAFIHVKMDDKLYSYGKRENNNASFYENGNRFEQFLHNNKLYILPPVDKNFISKLNDSKEGEIIDLNSRISLVCTRNNKEQLIFIKRFEGSLDTLTVDDFRKEERYVVNKNDASSYQALFAKAYNSRTSAAEIRTRFNSEYYDGYDSVNSIEANLPDNSIAIKNIGPIKLKISKQGNVCRWFDTNGTPLDKKNVAFMFSWAKYSGISIDIIKDCYGDYEPAIPTDVDCKYISMVKRDLLDNNIIGVLKNAKEYTEFAQTTSLTFTGLEEKENGYDACSFVFKNMNNQIKILKLTYINNDCSLNNIKDVTPVSEDEFANFCRNHFHKEIEQTLIEYQYTIHNLLEMFPNKSEGELQEIREQVVQNTKAKLQAIQNSVKINALDNNIQTLVNNIDTEGEGISDYWDLDESQTVVGPTNINPGRNL